MNDYFDLLPHASHDLICTLQRENEKKLQSAKKGILAYRLPFESVSHLKASSLDLESDVVTIGRREDLSKEEHALVYNVMRGFMPWRKGPYNVFGIDINAEWRSNRKWDRVLPQLPDLEDKIVADVGSSNGYYMFRMLPHKPRAVIGFEPYIHHYFTFRTLNSFAGLANLHMELLGVEHLSLYQDSFDVVFLMGILYHRISPLESLKEVRKSMKQGGTLIVESQSIPGEEPVALFPASCYAKVPGTYFVPTAACLKNWMIRAGFTDVEIFCSHPMSNKEQRKTEWMVFESYDDFVDPDNPSLTVEGYPAPLRVFLKGTAR
ncbi:MAG: tRNA 5-methoxyuridine(34)/uridine 5-oxyacetic acid(34) synthase CmoB [Desulfobulbaceae bacterium]|uniref:tRNA 5-methoxyuridine(34)/uridine 5-oxyacetic acid(34) synthase CmoB n=1 Tax=Candidatus Desulfobia pelagia TaxID=2841692 RepID=A0A8J6NDA7_9BACT|nr:tRNA 5-methoxyuridine(34)/uridine 5-oxyacetic acid(34) synthase CmoB [Candidatus Desulfobia pelagia]